MTWLVALLVGLTVLLAVPRPATLASSPSRDPAPRPQRALLIRLRPVLALAGLTGGWALVGGPLGWLAGAVAAVAVWVVLGRTEDPAAIRRRVRLAEELPVGVDLMGSCLDAGAAAESALLTVAAALEGPVGEEFRAIHHRLGLGLDPAEVWRVVARHPQLGPLGRAVGRAHETGAAVGVAVHHLAAELRDRTAADVEARARSIEVKAAAPLGLCLLPAFMLLGVVPMVVAVFTSMPLLR